MTYRRRALQNPRELQACASRMPAFASILQSHFRAKRCILRRAISTLENAPRSCAGILPSVLVQRVIEPQANEGIAAGRCRFEHHSSRSPSLWGPVEAVTNRVSAAIEFGYVL